MSNEGYQPKTILKYLLFIYAFTKGKNLSYPFDLQLTSNSKMFKDFKIGETGKSNFTNRMLEMGIIVISDKSYHYGDNGSYCRKYSVVMTEFRKELERYFINYFLLDDDLVNLSYFNDLNEFIHRIEIKTDLWHDNSVFNKDYNRKTKKEKLEARIDNDEISTIVDFLINDMLTLQAFENDYFEENERDFIRVFEKEDGYDAVFYCPYLISREKPISKMTRDALSLIRKRTPDSLLKQTTITIKNLDSNGHIIELTDCELKIIRYTIISLLLKNQIVRDLALEAKKVGMLGFPIKMSFNLKIKSLKGKLKIKYSTRQTNDFSKLKSAHRAEMNAIDGFNGNFDLHSAVFAVARLLECGKWGDIKLDKEHYDEHGEFLSLVDSIHERGMFGCDWDIKQEIVSRLRLTNINGEMVTKSDLKSLMFRLFFGTTLKDSFRKYQNALGAELYSINKGWFQTENGVAKPFNLRTHKYESPLPIFDYGAFEMIYDLCEQLCGPMKKYATSIFLYESLLELTIIEKMISKGLDVRNVYDCFYFKNNQVDINEVKAIIDNAAVCLFLEYKPFYQTVCLW